MSSSPAAHLIMELGLSSDGQTPIAGATLTQFRRNRLALAPGKSVKFHLRFRVTGAITPGVYYAYASVTLAGVVQTAFGHMQFTIA